MFLRDASEALAPRRRGRRRRWPVVALLGAACVVVVGCREPVPPGVMLDGRFDDWAATPVLVDDAGDAPDATLDLGHVQVQSDADWVYLAFDVGRELTVQNLPGTLRVLVDADHDATTGAAVSTMTGVDYVIDYSYRASPAQERGAGAVIWRAVAPDGLDGPISPYRLGLTMAPVHASARFEMRMARAGAEVPGLPPLGPETRLKLIYVERDAVVDDTAEFVYRVEGGGPRDVPQRVAAPLDWIRRADDTIRFASWNVADASFRDQSADFARILATVEPDVLALSELPGDVTVDSIQAFLDQAPLRALGTWTFALGVAGGRQRAVVAARNRPLEGEPLLLDVRYEAEDLARLRLAVPPAMQPTIDLEQARGLSAVAAWVDVGPGPVLVTSLDLQSAGWLDSPQDRLRILQAKTIRSRIDAALDAGSGPVVVTGDVNLVGSRMPLEILAATGHAGRALSPIEPRRLGERTLATWRNPRQAFTPGRLDYMLAPPEVDVVRAFAFATEDLDGPTLAALGLEAELSLRLSDHVILVSDLRFR